MQNFTGDIRYALRQFRRAPVFTASAVLTLAIGIGGTTAIFSLIHAVMLRSLPVADPASLYRIGDGYDCCVEGGPQNNWGMYSFPLFEQLKAAAPEFGQVTAFSSTTWEFSVRRAKVEHAARPLHGEYVTGNYFSTFGIRPFAGRLFSPNDDQASAAPVAVLSYRAWRGPYAGDPSVIGSTYIVGGHPFTVIGIAPPGFYGETLRSDPPDIWIPLHQEPLLDGKGALLPQSMSAWLRAIGRLKPGATTVGMSARLTGVLRNWMKNDSGYPAVWMPEVIRLLPKQLVNVVPAGGGVEQMKEYYGRSLNILLAVCCLVLLIACANVANLLLARGMARRSDTALRLAIGAPARRLIGQSLTESVLLSIFGGILGLAVAYGAARLLLMLAFHSAHFIPIQIAPSLPVLAFAFGLSLITGVLFGTAPAWFATRTNPMDALRGAHRTAGDRSSFSRNALLAVQATLSIVLVAGAAMLARSLSNLEHQDLGYPATNRISVQLQAPPATYTPERLNALYRNLEDRLTQIPGIQRSGLALYNPFTDNWGELILRPGHPLPKFSSHAVASWDRISAGYLQALGQPILRGRDFTKHDTDATGPVAVVNQAFVKRFFPKENPLDKYFGLDMPENAHTFRIVGVARDSKFTQPDKPTRPMFFVPLAQHVKYKSDLMKKIDLRSHFIGGILLETSLSPGALEPVLKKTLAQADPNLTIIGIRTMRQMVAQNFDQQRAVATLAGLFGIVALLLAAVGLYGVTAYTVAQRTSEIGVRMALGADRGSVIRLILHGAFKRAAFGLLLGIPLAIGAGRLISSQLYGVADWDPIALAIAAGSLALCAFFAALLPARRAASIEPMKALRVE
ncbi:MAG TPA: ABC transporter permease [Bryobacteraceae bacterium]